MSLSNVLIVAKGNAKTGAMPTTSRGQETCPTTCPFIAGNGCYGDGRHWGTVNKFVRPMISHEDAVAKLATAARAGATHLRDRVLGDLVTPEGDFDREYVAAIAAAAADAGLRPYGYTHAWAQMTPADVAEVAASGYVLNASTETPAEVAAAVVAGLPVTIVNDDIAEGTMVAGKRVVTCPEQTRGIKCADCLLCARPQRAAVVRFLTHGATVRKARAAVAERNAA